MIQTNNFYTFFNLIIFLYNKPVVMMLMSMMPVLGSVADCFNASLYNLFASLTSHSSTTAEKRTFARASDNLIRDSSCLGYADTRPLRPPISPPIFRMSMYACFNKIYQINRHGCISDDVLFNFE